jgi:nucleoside-diphosphate-sugar epimerase
VKIVVIGGTGLIGSKTVAILRQRGHEVLAASPNSDVNTITGEGLKEAMAGAQVVIDLANSRNRWCRWAMRASGASAWTNGSAAHRQQPDPASEVRPICHERVPGNERKRRLR